MMNIAEKFLGYVSEYFKGKKSPLFVLLHFCGPDSETLTSNTRELVGLSFDPKAFGRQSPHENGLTQKK